MADEYEVEGEEEKSPKFPPPPPGIDLPPPPPGIDLPPPQMNFSQPSNNSDYSNEFPDSLSGDGDLLDAATELNNLPPPNMNNEISDFKSVWESRKNNNPELSTETRENLYSKINKISSSRDGSLLDRFSDRFGSELDREIIVLRKKEQQDLRSIKPKVELISIPDQSNEMTFSEFKESMEDEEFISKVADATGISEEAISGMDLDELKVIFY